MADDNPQEAIQKLLDKHKGDAQALALHLFGENVTLRNENSELKKKVPADGAIVITKADHDRYEAYKALGKPDELKTKIESADALTTENANLKRAASFQHLREAGYDPDAVKDFDDLEGKEIEAYSVKDEKDSDGKDAKVAYVTVGGKERPLAEYAKEKRPKLVPALRGGEKADTPAPDFATQGFGEKHIPDKFKTLREQTEARFKAQQPPAAGSVAERFYGRKAS
jgi:hypothetical protein